MKMNNLQKQRVEKGEILETLGGTRFGHNHNINRTAIVSFIEEYKYMIENIETTEFNFSDMSYSLVGRLVAMRKMGKSAFIKVQDMTGDIQGFVSVNDTEETFEIFKKAADMGDIVHLKGYPFVTKTKELSIKVKEFEILTKSYNQLPDKHSGLKDVEAKYRQRYLHMIDDMNSTQTIIKRSKIVSTIRRFFEDMDFLEVETPMLNPIPGGANAKPFITHHNALGVDRYLRIAPELYLKKLVVGGLDKVFEIGKNFRNEGIDATHNPEFTSVEFYQTLENYKGLMLTIENLFNEINNKINPENKGIIKYGKHDIDLNNFKVISFKDALVEIGGVECDVESRNSMIDYLESNKYEIENPDITKGKLWEFLFDEFVELKLIQPTFIIDYPVEISPLARRKDDNPELTERFELFVAGKELANGFNELNDPIDQYERFMSQVAQKDNDDEAMHMDHDFIDALMQGMTPVAGAGIGIDRLVMLFTNNSTIKDVIAFPAMK